MVFNYLKSIIHFFNIDNDILATIHELCEIIQSTDSETDKYDQLCYFIYSKLNSDIISKLRRDDVSLDYVSINSLKDHFMYDENSNLKEEYKLLSNKDSFKTQNYLFDVDEKSKNYRSNYGILSKLTNNIYKILHRMGSLLVLEGVVRPDKTKYIFSHHLLYLGKSNSPIKIPFFVLMNGTDISDKKSLFTNSTAIKWSTGRVSGRIRLNTSLMWGTEITPPEPSRINLSSAVEHVDDAFLEEAFLDKLKSSIFNYGYDNNLPIIETIRNGSTQIKRLRGFDLTPREGVRPSSYRKLENYKQLISDYISLINPGYTERHFDNEEIKKLIVDFVEKRYKVAGFYFTKTQLKDILPRMLRDYLLSGLQGFMINDSNRHSIESSAMMTRKSLYDDFVELFGSPDYMPRDENAKKLFSLTKMMPYEQPEKLEALQREILTQVQDPNGYRSTVEYDGTCQIYKITPYNVKDRIWLKIIWSMRHLGASCNIFDITKRSDQLDVETLTFNSDDINNFRKSDIQERLELIKDYYTRHPHLYKATLSYSNVILLAATTLDRKVESVRLTLEAADVITTLTRQKCEEVSSGSASSHTGGGYDDFNHLFKKSYRNYINGLNKNYKQKALK